MFDNQVIVLVISKATITEIQLFKCEYLLLSTLLNWISLNFGQIIRSKKEFKYVNLHFGKL